MENIEKFQSMMRKKGKNEFSSHLRTYRHTCMLFGLRNLSIIFQSASDITLSRVQLKTCFDYLGDVVLFFINSRQHVKDVSNELILLHQDGVTLKIP